MVWVGESHRILSLLREQLGLQADCTVLRYLRMELSEEARTNRIVLALELHETLNVPPLGGQWLDRANLAEIPLADEGLRALLLAYLDEEAAGQNTPLRAPWAQPGWFSETAGWMRTTLTALGRPPTGPVQQFRNLGISSILRVPTEDGLVYCKATAKLPLFINEAALMNHLADRFPGQIPPPLAIEEEKGWMLLDDFGPELGWNADAEAIGDALRQFGALQAATATAKTTEELLAVGCFDRRLSVLVEQIDFLAKHPLTARHAKADDLSQLRLLVPKLQARCVQLAAFHLPDTLVHGDLHMSNLARNGDGFLFYDWSDSCIGHPFLDMIAPYFFQEEAETKARLRDAYLSQWTEWEPVDRLREAWRLAKPLAALHQAVSYLHILLGQEELVHGEMADGLRGFVARALASLAEDEEQKETD